ncbi:hypothetical protein ASPVEDRAFT_23364 [Aspergillus versicolor CBS 583.65]|uniref:Uncharacterized protein n=1 Tax=Aspergillus versicolor CBS 583.65 TaxID=1036611 RepID=A0A1L9P4A3_ASPVE|nr:uncharacterized protein ASPVEDRAFT_23364 [Aspergillus versicolor CBS 583.65]OJI96345.1 hypothetical protein ASPVEDRAFT_23364 [Aspergillus versicolor CBS 583.65]
MTEFRIPLESLTSIRDKIVLITGSSSGIGKATVSLCLSLGARVIAGDINPPPDEFLQQHGGAERVSSSLFFEKTNVADWASIRNLFVKGVERFGGIDHVFANAGIGPRSNFLEETFEDDGAGELLAPPNLQVLDVNLIGVIYTVRLGVYYLRQSGKDVNNDGSVGGQRSPGITVTASASSFQDFGAADYTVAKHGVLGILRGLYADLMYVDSSKPERTRVRLNAISPSWTATGVVPRDVLTSMGVGVQEPEVVARSVVMLFTDSARHGEVIYSWEGRYCEINRCEGGLLDGVSRILPSVMDEGPVMEKLKGR